MTKNELNFFSIVDCKKISIYKVEKKNDLG